MVIQPHDLIEISELSQVDWDGEKEWVSASLRRTPFVVARRSERTNPDYIPVGIRGVERNQRQAAYLNRNGIQTIITPYTLAEQKRWKSVDPQRQKLPVFSVLDTVAEIMGNWRWGPTGSAGFEMAAGNPSVKETSDLDMVVHAPQPIDIPEAEDFLQKLDKLNVRVDIQIETGKGAFLLREMIDKRTDTVILRTCSGPKLVRDPWG